MSGRPDIGVLLLVALVVLLLGLAGESDYRDEQAALRAAADERPLMVVGR